jgi:isopenicillin N synthase-like dioxygenase
MSESIQSLKTEGVAMLPYTPRLRVTVEEAAMLWQSFCALPLEAKQTLPASSDAAGTGYEFKDGTGSHADKKENFDVAAAHQSYLEELLTQPIGDTEQEFARAALALSKEMSPLAVQFAEQVEREYGLVGFCEKVKASSDLAFIRFIHYSGGRATGDLIAEPHTDQSGFTFHLYETDSGCERLDYETDAWHDMPVENGKTAVIPAMQLQYESSGELRALAHRVVATEQTKDIGRYAIVCFVRLADSAIYDKVRHGRLQEKEPGFNYHISREEFDSLFIKPEVS